MTRRPWSLGRTAWCLLLAATFGSAHASASAPQDIIRLFADALQCRTELPDGRDNALAQKLRAHGIVVLDRAPGETLDLLYVFPQPLRIEGVEVSSIVVRGGSGSVVAAQAKGSFQTFIKRMHVHPHPSSQWALDGYGVLQAQYTRVQPSRPGMDETPPRLVIGRAAGDADGTFHWGCRSYDD